MFTQFSSVLWAKSGLRHKLLQYPDMIMAMLESARIHRVSLFTVASDSVKIIIKNIRGGTTPRTRWKLPGGYYGILVTPQTTQEVQR